MKNNKTLCDMMIDMYEKYGYYKETIITFTLKGIDGSEKIKAIMESLRGKTIEEIDGDKVLASRDYTKDERKLADGTADKMNMPKSNVLYYELENNGWFCVRPSGTEPKIKIYMGIKENTEEKANAKLQSVKAEIETLLNEMM